jgi:hypothetical protein
MEIISDTLGLDGGLGPQKFVDLTETEGLQLLQMVSLP